MSTSWRGADDLPLRQHSLTGIALPMLSCLPRTSQVPLLVKHLSAKQATKITQLWVGAAFHWREHSGAREKGKQRVDNQAPRKRNAGLEPAFSKMEMQTHSTSSAPLPALGAGLNKAITTLPGSLSVRRISRSAAGSDGGIGWRARRGHEAVQK